MSKLKPCPFCGSMEELTEDQETYDYDAKGSVRLDQDWSTKHSSCRNTNQSCCTVLPEDKGVD